MLRSLFGLGPKIDLVTVLEQGATILDVRTPLEFSEGHVDGSMNIPLDELEHAIPVIPRNKPVVVCCRSGARSASAEGLLRNHGFEAYNGGSWTNVEKLMKP